MRSYLVYSCPDRKSRFFHLLTIVAVITISAGCEEQRHVAETPGGQPRANKSATKPEFIVGKRTQDIRDSATEIRNQGAKVASTKITAKDPITLQGNAYVSIIGQTSILEIQHALDLYHATNDRYPKDRDEFMTEIIKANNIALPQLPNYQKYGYNEKEHKLEILEYEDLKNQPLGR